MATLKQLIRKALQMTTPTGTMLPFAGKSVPEGWLLCNGAAVSRTTYANLFAAIGTTWGTGDGSTTFNLPNCEGRFLEGTTNTSNVGTYLEAGLPNISGTFGTGQGSGLFWATDVSGAFYVASSETNPSISMTKYGNRPGVIGLTATNSSNVYGGSSSVQPKSAQTLIIIKV